jgi:hypothetical protein
MTRLFVRPVGPQCYEAELFFRTPSISETLRTLLDSALVWYWLSQPATGLLTPEVAARIASALEVRRLTEPTLSIVADHLAEGNEDDENEDDFVALFGFIAPLPSDQMLFSNVIPLIADFVAEKEPLTITMVHLGDQKYELIFVPHRMPSSVAQLLERLGIESAPSETVPYRFLRSASLEALFLTQ